MSPQSHQLDNHLYGEDHGEDHVEDVHDGGEELGLLIMLRDKRQKSSSGRVQGECWSESVPGRPESACSPGSAQTSRIQTGWS